MRPFSLNSKLVYKMMRGWTPGRSLSYKTLLSIPPDGGEGGVGGTILSSKAKEVSH